MKNAGIMLCATLWALAPFVAGCGTIHKSVDKGDLAKVEEHLQKGIGVDARDEWGRTPLMWSTEDLDVARYLVENGADVNARDAKGDTTLRWAATFGHLDVVKFLVQQGADVSVRDSQGQTPLKWAAAFGHRDVVKYLEKRADANDLSAIPRLNVADELGPDRWLEAMVAPE